MNKVYNQSDEDFKILIASSLNYSAVMKKLRLKSSGGFTFRQLKYRIKELNISVDHFLISVATNKQKYSLKEILTVDSIYTNTARLKKRLFSEGYIISILLSQVWRSLLQSHKLEASLVRIQHLQPSHKLGF